jgi:predicted RNase H-like HicB family nuclease
MSKREFYVLIERDDEHGFVGRAPQLRDCHAKGRTLDELMANIRNAIETALETDDLDDHSEYIGVYKVQV